MTELLNTLEKEINLLSQSGSSSLDSLVQNTDAFLQSLKILELELEQEVRAEQDRRSQLSDLKEENDENMHQDEIGFLFKNENENFLNLNSISMSGLSNNDHSMVNDTGKQPPKDDLFDQLTKETSNWYNLSISSLKKYNGQISKFLKNIVNNSKFKVDLDDAYSFPLDLNSMLSKKALRPGDGFDTFRADNSDNLMKSIAVHFFKLGFGSCVDVIIESFNFQGQVNQVTVDQFHKLGSIVEDITQRHDLEQALTWIYGKERTSDSCFELLFRLNMLQYISILKGAINGEESNSADAQNIDSSLQALRYASRNFPKFFEHYLDEIAPLMMLLLFKQPETSVTEKSLKEFIHKAFVQGIDDGSLHLYQQEFVAEILRCFDDIHGNQHLFDTMAAKLTAEYCSNMGLSSQSSLFEALLSGFVNLPNFYKYSRLQKKMNAKRPIENATEQIDMPFQLPDKNRFLFNYHPIFICPVSKEQLMPLTIEDEQPNTKLLSFPFPTDVDKNPVVVFDYCRHLALKESVRSLVRGSDKFKCHYCYKKHRILEVKDAYFIDL